MVIATHLIKIKGSVDKDKWTEETLREYIQKKIADEICPSFHAETELFSIKDNDAEAWVYISAFPSEIGEDVIKKWLCDHIKEDGITVKDFEIVVVVDLTNPGKKDFFVNLR